MVTPGADSPVAIAAPIPRREPVTRILMAGD